MNILVSILGITFLGSSVISKIEPNFKSDPKLLSYLSDVKLIKNDNPTLSLEIQNQPPTGNENDKIDTVPPA